MNKKLQKFYNDKYKLKKLKINISNKPVLALIYDDNKNYYLHNNKLVDIKSNNLLEEINQLNSMYKLKITNFYPVCFCNNTLIIALRCNNTNDTNLQKYELSDINSKYKKLIEFHIENYSNDFFSSDIGTEIEMSQKYINRYKFHQKFIKKYILTPKKRKKEEFNEILNSIIPKKESIIDITCGDNSDLINIAINKGYKLIVGNDICLNYLNINKSKDKNLIYTNDNIKTAKIKENSFDVGFCKNTLHHLNDIDDIRNVFDMLNKISNEIIIVEILNPKEEGGLPRFLNKYLYTKFLKDVGNNYLNENQIKKIVQKSFKEHNVIYTKFSNILGTYLIVKIKKKG